MPKGPRITAEVKRLIAEVNDKHPDWIAKKVKEEVQDGLRRLNRQVPPDWPGLSAVQIELKKIREEKEKGPLPVDGLWTIGRLADYEIPAEGIPKVLEIQGIRTGHEPLTIREAKWAGRLFASTQDIMELAVWAAMYAEWERNCELANIEKDTTEVDSMVRSKLVTRVGYFPWLFSKNWVPDSYKVQVAKEQTQKYEETWDLNLDRPEFTVNGWLIYSHVLQWMVLYDKQEWDEDVRERMRRITVSGIRQLAKNEGRIISAPGKYIDLLELMSMGVLREKTYSNVDEVFDASSREETKQEIDKLFGRIIT